MVMQRSWSRLAATSLAAAYLLRAAPTLIAHRVLRSFLEAQLVVERRDGTRRLYRSNHDEMARLRKFLDDYWTSSLDRLRDVAEAIQEQRDKEKSNG